MADINVEDLDIDLEHYFEADKLVLEIKGYNREMHYEVKIAKTYINLKDLKEQLEKIK